MGNPKNFRITKGSIIYWLSLTLVYTRTHKSSTDYLEVEKFCEIRIYSDYQRECNCLGKHQIFSRYLGFSCKSRPLYRARF